MFRIITLTLNPAVDKTCCVPQVLPEDKLRCRNITFHAGGGGINVARAATTLGGAALAVWTRAGATGELLERRLNEEQVPQQPVAVEGLTRENLIVMDESSEQQYRFGMPGAPLGENELQQCIDRLAEVLRDESGPPSAKRRQQESAVTSDSAAKKQTSDPATERDVRPLVVLSGSLPPGCSADQYAKIIDQLPPQSRIILDTSGPPLGEGVRRGVFLIKPNLRELGELAGTTIDNDHQIRDVCRRLIDDGQTEAVVVSLGSGGAVLTTSDLHEQIRSPTVEIRSKVGAGDSMVAGIAVALARQRTLSEAARFGVAAGAAAVMTEGTELCRRSDTERLYNHMQ